MYMYMDFKRAEEAFSKYANAILLPFFTLNCRANCQILPWHQEDLAVGIVQREGKVCESYKKDAWKFGL